MDMEIHITDKNNVLGQVAKRSGVTPEALRQLLIDRQKKANRERMERTYHEKADRKGN